jgi:glycosyltransferase involved in cell wall biosynthesis
VGKQDARRGAPYLDAEESTLAGPTWHPGTTMSTSPEQSSSRRAILFLANDIVYLYNFRGPLMQAFLAKGYEVLAVAPQGDPAMTHKLLALGVRYEPWRVAKTGTNPFAEAYALWDLFATIRRFRPTLFFGNTIKPVIYGTILSAILGVKRRVAMITGLGYAFLPGDGLKKWVLRRIVFWGYGAALARSDLAIFQNFDDIELFRANGLLGAKTAVAKVNGSGVDLARFAVTPLPDGPVRFLYVGRILRDKGLRELVDAARIVRRSAPDARFVLVGKQDTNPAAIPQSELDGWIAEGIVEHRGHLEDPAPEFRAAHVFVLPSYREGTPRATLEAMASGRAVVTTDVPGCRETVVDGENGFLVPSHNAQALAEAMLRLVEDRALLTAMAKRSREMAEDRFALDRVVDHTVGLIEGSIAPG